MLKIWGEKRFQKNDFRKTMLKKRSQKNDFRKNGFGKKTVLEFREKRF